MRGLVLSGLLLSAVAWGAQSETFYVQAIRAEVRKEPKTAGAMVAKVKRGDALSVVSKNDLWFEVKTPKLSGWIPRLFLSRYPPIGASELSNLPTGTSLEKASRRRPASFAGSAATRGLMLTERARKGQEKYPTDYEALARMEEAAVSAALLDKFRLSAKLPD